MMLNTKTNQTASMGEQHFWRFPQTFYMKIPQVKAIQSGIFVAQMFTYSTEYDYVSLSLSPDLHVHLYAPSKTWFSTHKSLSGKAVFASLLLPATSAPTCSHPAAVPAKLHQFRDRQVMQPIFNSQEMPIINSFKVAFRSQYIQPAWTINPQKLLKFGDWPILAMCVNVQFSNIKYMHT